MEMGIGEIRWQYKYAKDKKKCISILAELNCCSTEKILEIIHTQSERQKEQPKPAVQHPTSGQKALMDRPYEPNVVKAAWNIFGKSYEYRRRYNAYKEARKKEEKRRKANVVGQLELFGPEG